MYKQVIVVRTDLEMGKGKIAAQCSHASLSAYNHVRERYPDIAEDWEKEGQKKVVLKVKGEDELIKYLVNARDFGVPCELISDAGLTQIPSGTPTCFGAGPWAENDLDKIFKELKLL